LEADPLLTFFLSKVFSLIVGLAPSPHALSDFLPPKWYELSALQGLNPIKLGKNSMSPSTLPEVSFLICKTDINA
jgi:hypothetical protein